MKNINHDNYEEYFLLYADNELPADGRREVEAFINENPALKEEFDALMSTLQVPEESMKLEDTSFLLKTGNDTFINESNCREVFTAYHDWELNSEEMSQTEAFLERNPQWQQEFMWLGKARLTPDKSIVYPNKESLYKTAKTVRVIPIYVWRMAAAAVVVGIGLWITIPYFNTNADVQPLIVATKNAPAPSVKTETRQANNETNRPLEQPTERDEPAQVGRLAQNDLAQNHKPKSATPAVVKEKIIRKEQPDFEKKMIESVTEPAAQIAVNRIPNKIENKPVVAEVMARREDHIDQPDPRFNNPAVREAQVASMQETTSDENYIFYNVPADEFKKTKVGSFLKKVKRVVDRNNPITRLFADEGDEVAAR